jgi:hypothetical protein
MKHLADCTVKPGETVQRCSGLQLKVLQVNPTEHAHILSKHMTSTNRNATCMIVKLVPRFSGSVEHWGGHPAAPSGKQEMVESIMGAWAGVGNRDCVRHKDGNTMNCSFANLQEVSLDAALKHADDWKVDWVCDLSSAEIQCVKNDIPHFLGLVKIQREGTSICSVCDCADEEVKKLLVCGVVSPPTAVARNPKPALIPKVCLTFLQSNQFYQARARSASVSGATYYELVEFYASP